MTANWKGPRSRRRHPRVVIGPCICQGCRSEVVMERLGRVWLGWLHEDGSYRCPGKP